MSDVGLVCFSLVDVLKEGHQGVVLYGLKSIYLNYDLFPKFLEQEMPVIRFSELWDGRTPIKNERCWHARLRLQWG